MDEGDRRFTKELAVFIETLRYEMLPDEVVHMANKALLDFLGCIIFGYHSASSQIVLRYLRAQGGTAEASIVISGEKTSCSNAALAHGTMACSTELDDLQPRGYGCHAGEIIMPVVLGIGERDHRSGKQVIAAIVAGYETAIRVGAAKTAEPYFKGVSSPALSGPFGAAAAACKLYGLGKKAIENALGICFPSLVPFGTSKAGALAKDVKAGLASCRGLFSADMARGGIDGVENGLDRGAEGIGGVFQNIFGRYDGGRVADALGEEWEILHSGFKPFASCGLSHAPLTGIFEILKTNPVLPKNIEKINVRSFKLASELGNQTPSTPNAARFSIPYAMSCALVNGCVMPECFTEEELKDPQKRELSKKVEVIWDPRYDEQWAEKHACMVEILTRDGQTFKKEVTAMKGHPDLPLTDGEIIEKFEKLSVPTLGKEKVNRIIDTVLKLQELDDMNGLIRCLQQ